MSGNAEATFDGVMTARRTAIYVACEDMDFVWSRTEVFQFDQAWKRGESITEIADSLDRDCDEVALLAIDRGRKGHIKARPGGVFGTKEGSGC